MKRVRSTEMRCGKETGVCSPNVISAYNDDCVSRT